MGNKRTGNVGSHVFDIVWPAQSAIMKKAD